MHVTNNYYVYKLSYTVQQPLLSPGSFVYVGLQEQSEWPVCGLITIANTVYLRNYRILEELYFGLAVLPLAIPIKIHSVTQVD